MYDQSPYKFIADFNGKMNEIFTDKDYNPPLMNHENVNMKPSGDYKIYSTDIYISNSNFNMKIFFYEDAKYNFIKKIALVQPNVNLRNTSYAQARYLISSTIENLIGLSDKERSELKNRLNAETKKYISQNGTAGMNISAKIPCESRMYFLNEKQYVDSKNNYVIIFESQADAEF